MLTNNHWSKLLNLEEARSDKEFLKQFKSPFVIFRPLFYFLITLLSKVLFKAKIHGISNIPKEGPYIIAANHSSAADYPLIAWAMPRRARESLYTPTTSYFYDNPFVQAFMMIATNSIRIETEKDFIPALQVGAKVLAQGKSIYINPEGTWSEDGRLLPFKVGVGLLSFELNVPIVPVYIGGTFEMLPPHAIFPKKFGKITIAFGKPIYPDKYKEFMDKEEAYYVYKRITEDLRNHIINLQQSY